MPLKLKYDVKDDLKCPGIKLGKFLDCAFRAIVEAKLGLVNKDEALDALWEYLVNIDYEVRKLREINGNNLD